MKSGTWLGALVALVLGVSGCGETNGDSGDGDGDDVSKSGGTSGSDGGTTSADGGSSATSSGGALGGNGGTDSAGGASSETGGTTALIEEADLAVCGDSSECIVVPYSHCCGATKRAINSKTLDAYNAHPEWQVFNDPGTCAVIGACLSDENVTSAVCSGAPDGSCQLEYP